MQGTDSIHNMRAVNKDATSCQAKTLEKCLETADKENKKKYLNACLKQHRHFTLFTASVDDLLWVEADAILKRITIRLATKWNHPYTCTCGYVKSRVAITLVWSTQRCIRGARVPTSQISVKRP